MSFRASYKIQLPTKAKESRSKQKSRKLESSSSSGPVRGGGVERTRGRERLFPIYTTSSDEEDSEEDYMVAKR